MSENVRRLDEDGFDEVMKMTSKNSGKKAFRITGRAGSSQHGDKHLYQHFAMFIVKDEITGEKAIGGMGFGPEYPSGSLLS